MGMVGPYAFFSGQIYADRRISCAGRLTAADVPAIAVLRLSVSDIVDSDIVLVVYGRL
jgi:hypothetical protein